MNILSKVNHILVASGGNSVLPLACSGVFPAHKLLADGKKVCVCKKCGAEI